jgi:putative membrane protein
MQKFTYNLLGPALVLALGPFSIARAEKAASLSHADTSFLSDAAQGGMDEVRLGEMAEHNATNEHVRAFGKKMVDDHTRLGNQLETLASHKVYTLPGDISITQKASNKLLSVKTGRSFDESYVSSMVKDHKDDIAAFEKEANNGADADVRAWASQALPTLREHLRMAEELAHEMGVKY